jgi:hypothetical protein
MKEDGISIRLTNGKRTSVLSTYWQVFNKNSWYDGEAFRKCVWWDGVWVETDVWIGDTEIGWKVKTTDIIRGDFVWKF